MVAAVTLEVPLDSLDSARLAAPFADRLELCDDLATEGWTPSTDLIRGARDLIDRRRTVLVAMIRPRLPESRFSLEVADFATTPRLLDASLLDVDRCAAAGADEVAVGPLTMDGRIDREATRLLRDRANRRGLGVAFLRTFDLLADRSRGWTDLTELGIGRVLTAGVHGWNAGSESIERRVARYRADRDAASQAARATGMPAPAIAAGGGVRSSNATSFLAITPHLHASCRTGGRIDPGELAALRAILDDFARSRR